MSSKKETKEINEPELSEISLPSARARNLTGPFMYGEDYTTLSDITMPSAHARNSTGPFMYGEDYTTYKTKSKKPTNPSKPTQKIFFSDKGIRDIDNAGMISPSEIEQAEMMLTPDDIEELFKQYREEYKKKGGKKYKKLNRKSKKINRKTKKSRRKTARVK
jgi:hypothetical protein